MRTVVGYPTDKERGGNLVRKIPDPTAVAKHEYVRTVEYPLRIYSPPVIPGKKIFEEHNGPFGRAKAFLLRGRHYFGERALEELTILPVTCIPIYDDIYVMLLGSL